MNRRDFLKALTAMAGAAITPAFAKSLPETIPDTWDITIGYFVDGGFNPFSSVKVSEIQSGKNTASIVFPECTHNGWRVMSHVSVNGQIIPLDNKVVLTSGITPIFNAGALSIEEE